MFQPIRITVCYWRENRQNTHASDRFPCLIDGGEGEEDMDNHSYALPSDEYPGYVKVMYKPGFVLCVEQIEEHKKMRKGHVHVLHTRNIERWEKAMYMPYTQGI